MRFQFLRFLSPTYIRLYGRLMTDRRTPRPAKAAVILALAYVISPFDLVPDWIVGLGWLDDLVILVAPLIYLVRVSPPQAVAKHLRDIKGAS